VGLRWRTEKEVIDGKVRHEHHCHGSRGPFDLNPPPCVVLDLHQGQFSCGNKHCGNREGLASYEVNRFGVFQHRLKVATTQSISNRVLIICDGACFTECS